MAEGCNEAKEGVDGSSNVKGIDKDGTPHGGK